MPRPGGLCELTMQQWKACADSYRSSLLLRGGGGVLVVLEGSYRGLGARDLRDLHLGVCKVFLRQGFTRFYLVLFWCCANCRGLFVVIPWQGAQGQVYERVDMFLSRALVAVGLVSAQRYIHYGASRQTQ